MPERENEHSGRSWESISVTTLLRTPSAKISSFGKSSSGPSVSPLKATPSWSSTTPLISDSMNTNQVIQYLKDAKSNYVVMRNDNTPVCWSDGSGPVVYGSRADCDDNPNEGEYIITEYDYIKSVMLADNKREDRYTVFYKDGDEVNDYMLTYQDAMDCAKETELDGYEVIVCELVGDEYVTVYETPKSE